MAERKIISKKFLFDKLKQHDENFKNINKIKFSEHHYSHAASAFFPSPFEEAIILTLDGVESGLLLLCYRKKKRS